ncbi:MAG: LysM peptidoglycan-binding domain-containing protein [Anaerolineales bacterium]|nr:LysM peptidoglycan-binding domain-containing protein [Anaerolineales bacterium]
MRGMRDFGNALIVAVVSVGLMLGALSISLVEFVPEATLAPTANLFPSPIPVTATSTFPPTFTSEAVFDIPTPTTTMIPAGSCQPPGGWRSITVRAGDTLDSFAARYRISKEVLRSANCLLSDNLLPGTVFYVPPALTSTPIVCSPGAVGWVRSYVVRPGDTIYSIAVNHYTTASLLKSVNCRSSDIIYINETLWVPSVATRTPVPTPLPGSTVTPIPTEPLTQTALPFTATVIPSDTSIPPSPTAIPTSTPVPTSTPSPTAFP